MNKIFLGMLGIVFMSACKENDEPKVEKALEEPQEVYNYVTPPEPPPVIPYTEAQDYHAVDYTLFQRGDDKFKMKLVEFHPPIKGNVETGIDRKQLKFINERWLDTMHQAYSPLSDFSKAPLSERSLGKDGYPLLDDHSAYDFGYKSWEWYAQKLLARYDGCDFEIMSLLVLKDKYSRVMLLPDIKYTLANGEKSIFFSYWLIENRDGSCLIYPQFKVQALASRVEPNSLKGFLLKNGSKSYILKKTHEN